MPSIANYLMGQDQNDIRFQSLTQSFKGYQARKGYCEITFTTDQAVNPGATMGLGGELFERLPLIIWLDREKCKEVEALPVPDGMSGEHYMDLRLAEQALQQVRNSGVSAKLEPQNVQVLMDAHHVLQQLLGDS